MERTGTIELRRMKSLSGVVEHRARAHPIGVDRHVQLTERRQKRVGRFQDQRAVHPQTWRSANRFEDFARVLHP